MTTTWTPFCGTIGQKYFIDCPPNTRVPGCHGAPTGRGDPPPMIRLLRRSRSTMLAAGNGPDTPQFRRTDNEYVLVRIDIAGSIKDVWIGEVLELHGLTTGFKYAM
jgi:hypothetical protein